MRKDNTMSKTKQWAWDTAEKVSDDIINSYVKGCLLYTSDAADDR